MPKRTEVHSQEIRQQLAVYRELSSTERDRLRMHLAGCPSCAATLAGYQAQDQLLSSLPPVSPSPELIQAVRARTSGQRRSARRLAWRWVPVALSLILVFSLLWSGVDVAADSLPGDALYPLKRWSEDLHLALTLDANARDRYREELAETRREEVRAVVRLQREVRVAFSGELVSARGDLWVVNGFSVTVSSEAWAGASPPIGSLLLFEAEVAGGQIRARQVRVLEAPQVISTPDASPEGALPASPTPIAVDTPTSTPPAASTAEPSQPRTPTAGTGSPHRLQTLMPGDDRASLPGTVTPGTGGPGPQPWLTPGAGGPGAQPTVTPDTGGPGPQPSVTPGAGGPGAQPSVTPGSGSPGAQPTATPGAGGPGPQRTVGPSAGGPGRHGPLVPETASPTPSPSPVTDTMAELAALS